MLKNLIISTRPKQWYKNILIFAGIIFTLNFQDASMWRDVILAFVFFCMLSGGEYLINDILDREKDRKHPVKCRRPIAYGSLKVSHAALFAILLIMVALFGSYLTINIEFFLISASYLLLILLYSSILKYFVIVDILVISIGFVIRAYAGCIAISVSISPWLIICTFLLALFLALGKRINELVVLGDEAEAHRVSLSRYSTKMLEQFIGITAGTLTVSYFLYTFHADDYYLMITIPFVVYGLFRYLFLVHQKNFGGEPEMIFKDRATLINLVIWALLVVLILYIIPAWGLI